MKFIELHEADANDIAAKLDADLADNPRVQVGGGIHVPPEQLVRLTYVTKLPTEVRGVVRVPVNDKIEALAMDSLPEKLSEIEREMLFEKIAIAVEGFEEKLFVHAVEDAKEDIAPITLEEAK